MTTRSWASAGNSSWDCVSQAAAKGEAPWPGFRAEDLNEVHPIAMDLDMQGWQRPGPGCCCPTAPRTLSAPCVTRTAVTNAACATSAICMIWPKNVISRPVTITSFEHLMDEIADIAKTPGETYVGSCCQAFLAKHQHEMAAAGVRGVIVGLNSLTCYDLGKETDAYAGTFEKQSQMETALFSRGGPIPDRGAVSLPRKLVGRRGRGGRRARRVGRRRGSGPGRGLGDPGGDQNRRSGPVAIAPSGCRPCWRARSICPRKSGA